MFASRSFFVRFLLVSMIIFLCFGLSTVFLVSCDDDDDEEDIDPNLDSDGDMIKDIDEVSDVGKNLGLNRYKKDIVVEIDYFTRSNADGFGRLHYRMEDNAKAIVEQMFAQAPVSNPDGSQGISIHILVDDAIPNDSNYTGSATNQGYYDWTEFQLFKDSFFTNNLKNIAHYCLFVKDIGFLNEAGFPRGISGISRNNSDASFFQGAQDFIVSLGQWPNNEAGSYVWDKYQAGTFAHELGHNLGLGHGGQDHMNYKPNYLSIMNYSFQTLGLIKTGQNYYSVYDYSRLVLPILYEVSPDQNCSNINNVANALNEAAGLGAGAAGYGTIYYYYTGNQFLGSIVGDATANIDWNRNGQINGNLVWANINQDLLYCGSNSYHNLTTLTTFSDWDKISYTGGGYIGSSGTAKRAELMETQYIEEMSYDEHKELVHKLGIHQH